MQDIDAETDQNNRARLQYSFYCRQIPETTRFLHECMESAAGPSAALTFYQRVGDNIRSSGSALSAAFDPGNFDSMPERLNNIIKAVRKYREQSGQPARIVIDAIRNPFEALFFRDRYTSFYLVSINCTNSERIGRLHEMGFSKPDIKAIDAKDYPGRITGEKRFISQDLQSCISLADLHLHNPNHYGSRNKTYLKRSIMRYYELMQKPALINPTQIERTMQVAYAARFNSGCLSRQVGAVVTDQDFIIKGIGWNDTPKGQVPCLLRSIDEIDHDDQGFSLYERSDEGFRKEIQKKSAQLKNVRKSQPGVNLCYCFKDLQNEKEGHKNQVHTRSLHAEENAIVQVAKHGGQPVKGGRLFTTASPCELCSKKAYQLGVKEIHYIDPYPGIATDHVLASGTHKPELKLFEGAIGRAYFRLYEPITSYKDELNLLSK